MYTIALWMSNKLKISVLALVQENLNLEFLQLLYWKVVMRFSLYETMKLYQILFVTQG